MELLIFQKRTFLAQKIKKHALKKLLYFGKWNFPALGSKNLYFGKWNFLIFPPKKVFLIFLETELFTKTYFFSQGNFPNTKKNTYS